MSDTLKDKAILPGLCKCHMQGMPSWLPERPRIVLRGNQAEQEGTEVSEGEQPSLSRT